MNVTGCDGSFPILTVSPILPELGVISFIVGAASTVIALVAVKPPSSVVTVIVVVPTVNGVTIPSTTVATNSADENHVIDLFVALAGVTVSTNVPIAPPVVNVIVP